MCRLYFLIIFFIFRNVIYILKMAILAGIYFGPGSNPEWNRMEARNTQLSKTLRIKLMKKQKIKIRKQFFEDTMDNKEHHQFSSGSAGGSENSKHSPALNATVIHWNNLRQAFNHKIHNLNPTWTLTVSFNFFQKDSFLKIIILSSLKSTLNLKRLHQKTSQIGHTVVL